MRTVTVTQLLDADGVAAAERARHLPAEEVEVAPGRFDQAGGPFRHWEREVRVEAPGPDGHRRVTQVVRYHLTAALWSPAFWPLIRRSLLRPPAPGAGLWWAPAGLDARAASTLGLLGVFSVYAGYLGVLLSQTNAFVQREFDASNSDISNAAIAMRIGAFAALAIVAVADRRGRRRVLIGATYLAMITAATGAFVPNLASYALSQGVARVFPSAMALLLLVIVTEEVPAGARAFGVSLLTAAAGLGAGGLLLVLKIADLSVGAWRAFYLIPLPFLLTVPALRRRLRETRRFEVHELADRSPALLGRLRRSSADRAGTVAGTDDAPTHRSAGDRSRHRRRLATVGAAGLFGALFSIPSAAFLINYLLNERGFSAFEVTLFQILTSAPAGVALVLGGLLADRFGRRLVGSVGVLVGAGAMVGVFFTSGLPLWVLSTVATLFAGLVVPALTVYQTELFPTGNRSGSNGWVNLLTVIGSVVGLKAAGSLADHFGWFGPGMAILGIGPVVVVLIVVFLYPETADRELEELNPEDLPPPTGEALERLDAAFEHDLDDPHPGTGTGDDPGSGRDEATLR